LQPFYFSHVLLGIISILLKGIAKLSDIEITSIGNTVDIIVENGTIDIKNVNEEFEVLDIHQKGSHIDINIEDISFELAAELEGSEMRVPKTVIDVVKDIKDEKKNHRTIDLSFGKNPNRKINLNGKYGSFNLFLFALQ